jgi:polyhydroxybutyrate depolymerase
MSRSLVCAVLALAAGFGPSAAGAEVRTRTLDTKDGLRTYILFTPDARPPAGELPLIVALHGGGGTAEQMMSFSRFNAIAAREGFAVVYPQGTGRRWNDGRVFRGRSETDSDDVAFIRGVVADIATKGTPLDRQRIFAAGISNGGFMSFPPRLRRGRPLRRRGAGDGDSAGRPRRTLQAPRAGGRARHQRHGRSARPL